MWWHCDFIGLLRINAGQGSTPIDLTGLTVGFHLVRVTGVTVGDAENGLVSKEFIAAVVETSGRFYGYFVAIDGDGKEETFPVDGRRLVVKVYGD
ncbi:hypothetical protein Mal52_13830 [Symmachiella dynata]|uniref:Uncharacterized protein n=1 Tax=Symmachiella dynata TaxID=2527995 RepID=A0A517ZKH4_9PLAN|nr:hypothetical protein [Symmachiella dynata]QDU42913.1 hypothetical protein Mal52_13830 [Symmachiella dynata]